MSTEFGQVIVFTGEGKGKTSAALGTVIRALGNGWRVGWVGLYKEKSWKMSESEFFASLPSEFRNRCEFILAGKGFYIASAGKKNSKLKTAPVNDQVVIDDDSPETHQKAAQHALEIVEEMLKHGDKQLIVVDEVWNAVHDQLISLQSVISLIQNRKQTHLVLTGRYFPQEIIDQVDVVTEMKKVKHPFDQGKNAIKGLDF